MSEKKCGTCDYWEFGQRSYCSWKFTSGDLAVSSAYKAGGEGHAMWIDDGEDCPTWIMRDATKK